jgi:hypothetical protein
MFAENDTHTCAIFEVMRKYTPMPRMFVSFAKNALGEEPTTKSIEECTQVNCPLSVKSATNDSDSAMDGRIICEPTKISFDERASNSQSFLFFIFFFLPRLLVFFLKIFNSIDSSLIRVAVECFFLSHTSYMYEKSVATAI